MQWLVYMLECADHTYYIGSTNDLTKRLHAHNNLASGAKYTHARRPVRVVYTRTCADMSEAKKTEYALKQLNRAEKIKLVTLA